MIKMTAQIEGMACGMCEAHVADIIRRTFPEAKKVKASHKKGTAEFLVPEETDTEKLKDALAETGYRILAVSEEPYEKHGFFG